MKTTFPKSLPKGQIAIKREPRDLAYYSEYLKFDAERLVVNKKANPEKDLQEAKK